MKIDLYSLVREARKEGYGGLYAESKVTQDIVLKAIEKGGLGRNITIKGGIVMRSITKEKRRATRDMDFDFIHYSLDESSIRQFIGKLNSLDGIKINLEGEVEGLSQDDYDGKRVHVVIVDSYGHALRGKIDLGVHRNLKIKQEEYCFDICCSQEGASLLMNSKEQIFAEKLRSLLRFGQFSTRYKDVFDIYYLSSNVDAAVLLECLDYYVFSDERMHEKDVYGIIRRLKQTFSNPLYLRRIKESPRADWLGIGPEKAMEGVISFLTNLERKSSRGCKSRQN